MRAITYDHFGGSDVLALSDLPKPKVGPDSVLVRVRASSVNPVDWKLRQGYLAEIMDTVFPVVPGWDVAGVVEQIGLDTDEFEVGDEVFGYVRKDVVGGEVAGGTLAEFVAAPVRTLAHKPDAWSFEEAAAVPLAGLTAYQTIHRAGLWSGQSVLVHAAAGGVGSFAVQIARSVGARVIGTASEANHDYLRRLGAEPVTYGEGLAERVRALEPEGVDVVLDYVGGDALDSVPDVLRAGGTVASITDARARDEFGGQYVWVRPSATDLAELARLGQTGELKPEIAEVFDLADAAAAHERSEAGHVRGKIVIRV
ncbi:Alcohol dehydrogenase zinc-binding domain protein [Gordonia bronchialis DSM 43247]|uniref:Alcohol dehydrogenase zinc-binding domain protein n=1 Tax=Gordonia bronchialis (strain ATCC 25592 / DSM 43247 / BCRC 13721 / JCM 3198 / KCTC 3076 / NBRC 16047 / NCTC 10667) TaxID=526226 RepID=D0LES9_GORB4|nr:NADP-dependent oxidoreductase [Gordonia bronchialis]ACY21803.1 Alcohol dehydrogenase zinc-binding domain protein [Gordonia bronchialis DSM 43247]MCC3324590.1 NADP-dependent oxidoreductase [Gordonia bronchialis]QGS24595.1 zinc-binding dehydrogenase [Gordonia bronchialis]STQ64691.1 Zinc-type alcohol dehydrogenase-like protein SA1988 [Gordonia bronchialis]